MDLITVVAVLKPLAIVAGMAVFLGLIAYVFWPRRKREVEAHGEIPFRED
jgi:cbb3-type cytochrome oxidase subunit 3